MKPDIAHKVYDVLVTECGASEHGRDEFVYAQTTRHVDEFRFIGALGFGGKFWRNTGRRPDGTWGEVWYVSAYPEDTTERIEAMMDKADAALAALLAEHEADQ